MPLAKEEYAANVTPATGRPFTEVPQSTPEDIELALDAAHAAKDAWAETSTTDRARVLNAVADAIEGHREMLAVAVPPTTVPVATVGRIGNIANTRYGLSRSSSVRDAGTCRRAGRGHTWGSAGAAAGAGASAGP